MPATPGPGSPEPGNEVELTGGRANHGGVVRIGDQVARPRHPQTPAVDHFLGWLQQRGLDFVPRPLGSDESGRQRLSWIEGIVASPPYPTWAFDDDLLAEVAGRQRRLHLAADGYVAPPEPRWAVSAGDYFPAEATSGDALLVCHNDLGMTNTVVGRDTHAVAGFIDFDYSRPVDRLFDIAVAARHWVPFGDPPGGTAPALDRVARFGQFCDVHGLDRSDRQRVVDFAVAFLDKARRNVRRLADEGRAGFVALIEAGYEQTNRETVAWLAERRGPLADT